MKKRLTLAVAALAAFGMVAGYAASASAHPTQSSACTGCHGAASAISLSATQTSNDGTNATYRIAITGGSGAQGYAVLSGSTNIAHASASGGSVVVPVGKTYTVWAVDTNDGARSLVVSPVGPAPDPTPPATGTPDPTVTPTPSLGTTPAPAPKPLRCKVTIRVRNSAGHAIAHAKVTLVNRSTGHKYVKKTNSTGRAIFGSIPAGSYKVTATRRSAHLKGSLKIRKTTAKLTLRVHR